MGLVEAVSSEIRTLKKGDLVFAPFAFSDGSCEFCGKGIQTSYVQGGFGEFQLDGLGRVCKLITKDA